MIVVFDLDGVLVDAARDIANSANELVVSLGGRTLDLGSVTEMIGDGAAVLFQRALREGGLDPNSPGALPRFLDIYDRHLLDTTAPYPGLWETLTTSSGRATLAVLTSDPVADAATVPVNVYVAEPPAASVTVDAIEPLPEAAPHDEPVVAEHVHVAFVKAALNVSVTGASIAVDGPALLTTIE